MIEATIEEFEQGAWVADLVTLTPVKGSFELGGSVWSGATVSTQQDGDRILTRIVGGGGSLAKVLPDRWYDGSVSVTVALQELCSNSSEKPGVGAPGVFLTTFQRQRGSVAASLDAICDAFQLIWWVGRDGLLNMQAERPAGAEAIGVRVSSDVDSSVTLTEPRELVVGGTYDGQKIRHVRWQLTQDRFSAQLYFLPFVFRLPSETRYDRTYNARIDKQNPDGTVDVIADARFGVTRVPLFCGVPGAGVEVRPGEQVMLGFFGGSPQKPFAVAFAHDPTAVKMASRVTDSVLSTLTPLDVGLLAVALTPCLITTMMTLPGIPLVPVAPPPVPPTPGVAPFLINGQITGGTPRLKIGD